MHTERTQFAHNMHTHRYNNMQHREDNREQYTENNTENTETNNPAQPQHKCITDNLYIHNVDFYHEYAYIKNSDTIELYTISKD